MDIRGATCGLVETAEFSATVLAEARDYYKASGKWHRAGIAEECNLRLQANAALVRRKQAESDELVRNHLLPALRGMLASFHESVKTTDALETFPALKAVADAIAEAEKHFPPT